jgi:putative DNA methylase
VPQREVPREGRSDDRLIDYGYRAYHELFNPRQLLHLSCLAEAISATAGRVREALALAFSDHLATNCMMTYYAFGWRRLAPLFSIRAFRHVTRPVEINPWLDGTGRGTFPNAVRQVQRAIDFAKAPEVACLDGGFVASGTLAALPGQTRHIIRGTAAPWHGWRIRALT